jgi:hypothetical protein
MRALLTIALVLPAGGGCVGGGCNPSPPFPDDSCVDPSSVTVDTLEIGAGEGELFAPLSDGEIRPIVFGSQGGTMVTLTLRVTGTDLPGCVAQTTTLTGTGGQPGDLTFTDDQPKHIYPRDDGSFTTRFIYIQFWDLESGDPAVLHTEAGGLSDEVGIYLDTIGMPDAGVDAMIDAGPDAAP